MKILARSEERKENQMVEIYCDHEPGTFPETEFYRTGNGQLIHKRNPLHFATGDPVGGSSDPTLPAQIFNLLEKAHSDASGMSDNDIQNLADYSHNINKS